MTSRLFCGSLPRSLSCEALRLLVTAPAPDAERARGEQHDYDDGDDNRNGDPRVPGHASNTCRSSRWIELIC
jgi:hypothetical protein